MPFSRPQIRPARHSDLPALLALDSVAARDPQRRAAIAQWLHAGHCLVAETGGSVQGYAVLHRYFFGRDFLELLMVAPAQRGHGLGMALIQACAARCASGQLFTSANRSNAGMHRLLDRAGFVASGQIDNLDPGDPEQVYCLALPAPA